MTQVDRDDEGEKGFRGASGAIPTVSRPTRRRRRRQYALGVAAVVAALLVITSIEWGPHPLYADFDLPGTWSASADSYRLDPPAAGLPSIILKEDGTADAANLPTGSAGKTEEGFECFIPRDTFTGPATWAATSGGLVRILTDEITILWADTGYVGSLDWVELRLAECETDELVTLSGPELRDLS